MMSKDKLTRFWEGLVIFLSEWWGVFLLMFAFFIITMLITKPAEAAETVQTKEPPRTMMQWVPIVKREAQAIYGINAPVPMFLGQIWQESSGRPNITAWDLGRGGWQFMDGTTKQVSTMFPELGIPDPYNPVWSTRAAVRYMGWIRKIVQGDDDCQRFAAALKGYNAGPGYVKNGQRKSPSPGTWFGVTENINGGQSQQNFIYSRNYPRRIIFQHQKMFTRYGTVLCDIKNPPV